MKSDRALSVLARDAGELAANYQDAVKGVLTLRRPVAMGAQEARLWAVPPAPRSDEALRDRASSPHPVRAAIASLNRRFSSRNGRKLPSPSTQRSKPIPPNQIPPPHTGLETFWFSNNAFAFARASSRLKLKHIGTPKTNGKAERFIQTALREWGYARAYQTSRQRVAELKPWTHQYNWHRLRGSLKSNPPISRLSLTEDNLSTLHG